MEFTTQNTGAVVVINPASFKDAANLRKVIAKNLKLKKIIDSSDKINLSDVQLGSLLDLLADIDSSDEFEAAIFECLKVCIYDKGGKNTKITQQLFDDIPEIREDYYEIIAECVKENLCPFFKSLASGFNSLLKTQQQESPELK